MLDKDEIITVSNTPDYIYTNGTDESDVYADLGAAVCNDARGQQADEEYPWTAFINGEEQDDEIIPGKNVDEKWEYTDKGAVVEIYIDDYTLDVTVVEINYYLGEVSNVKTDDDDADYITVRALSEEPSLDDNTFYTTDFAEDDYVVCTVDFKMCIRDRDKVDKLSAGVRIPRLGELDDIAGAIAYLGSDDASWTTGEVLDVNGGLQY